ncbi:MULTISPECIES: glycosyltransferase [unclassified Microbacterium]|uniref:glycosyltransferase n=1 Tax=unclassified Microbacterium TaxID=2609290 RepID=UPI00386FE634
MSTVAIIGTRGYPSYYGGFETAVRKLAPHLADNGWDVTVYSRPHATVPADPTRDPRVKVRYTWGIERRSLSTLTFGLSSAVQAATQKPDVALIMNVANCLWLPIYKLRGIPTLVNVDGIEWERKKWGLAARTVFHLGARATARWANQLVFDAQAIAARWRSEFRREGVVIPYGGDPREQTLPLPGIVNAGEYVLLVCRFVPENTVEEFFEAVEGIAGSIPVVLVGSEGYGGPFDVRASGLAQRFADVHWLGHVKDDDLLHSLWQHAGVYFHGHTVGGTNPALVQAMALGAPTIAVDTVFNRETLGPSGRFVAPSARIIEAEIRELMSNPHERMRLGEDAKRRAMKDYSWDGVNSRYEVALNDLIASARDKNATARNKAAAARGRR